MSTYQDEKKYSSLARILKDEDYAIIDTCSLMEDSFPEFLDILEETKEEYLDPKFPVYVLESSLEELKKHAGNKEQKEKKISATQAIRILAKAKRKKTVEIIKVVAGSGEGRKSKDKDEEGYYFADVEIISKVTLDRTKYNVVVITQDKKLASDLLNLNNSQAVHGSKVHVFKIEPNATLSENKGEESHLPSKKTRSKAGSSVLLKEASKPSTPKKQKETQAQSQRQNQPKPDLSESITKVVANDKKIHANLSNANYSKDKMLKDLKSQLADLQKIPPETLSALRLSHGVDSIQTEIKKIENPTPARLPALPAPSKKESKGLLWYEYGQTIEEAFQNVGHHYGIFFRDPSVPYVPGIHGPVNFTTEDLAKISASYGKTLKEGQRIIKQYRSVYLMAERTPKGIKAWIDLNGVLAPQVASEKPEANKEKLKNEPKKKADQPKPIEAPDTFSASVDEPVAPSQKKGKKSAKPKESQQKPAESIETQPEVAVQNEAPQQESVSKKKAAAKKTASKAEEPNADSAKPKKKTHLEEAVEYDAKLKANVNNPNYPKEQKIHDVEEQILRVKKIPVKDRDALNYDLNALKTFLSILG